MVNNIQNNNTIEPKNTNINPQNTSTTTNNNPENIIIKETNLIQSAKNTVVIGQIDNNIMMPTNTPLPNPIDIKEKTKTLNTKEGKQKKVKIITPRERITNIIITIIFILLIGGLSYGAYYFLYQNNPKNFNALNITIELGEPIPNVSSYYINLKNISDLDYTLDISNVENKIGVYNYTVKYQNIIKKGTITIKDTKGPVITLKDNLNFDINSTITKEMLVESCTDPSNCQYEINKNIKTDTPGEYTITIIATDDLNNISTTDIPVTINNNITLNCSINNQMSLDNTHFYSEQINMTFDANNNLISAKKTLNGSYFFTSDFEAFQNTYQNNSAYQIDTTNKSFIYEESLQNINGLTDLNSIKNIYLTSGYTCN